MLNYELFSTPYFEIALPFAKLPVIQQSTTISVLPSPISTSQPLSSVKTNDIKIDTRNLFAYNL